MKKIICPKCKNEIDVTPSEIAARLGSITTPKKAAASKKNAKLGGWKKGRPRGKRPQTQAGRDKK